MQGNGFTAGASGGKAALPTPRDPDTCRTVMNLCCLKTPDFQQFAIAAVGNELEASHFNAKRCHFSPTKSKSKGV